MLYGFKNSFVVAQIHIPLDKINAVLHSQSPVQVQVVFQVREESFNAVGGGRNLWIGQVVKHVGQGSFDGKVRTPQQLMGVPVTARGFMEGFLLQVGFMAAIPPLQRPGPVKPVILCLDAEQHQHQSPELYTRRVPGKACQPEQTHSLQVYQTTLGRHIRQGLTDGFEHAFMAVCGNAFDLHAQFDQVIQIFFDLVVMLSIRKADQLCIAIFMVLVAKQTELLKVSSVQAQVNLALFADLYRWGFFQKGIEGPLKCIDAKSTIAAEGFKCLAFQYPLFEPNKTVL